MRAMDRAAKQAERQRAARMKSLDRQAHLDASARAASEYDEIVEALVGAHRVRLTRRDWLTTATSPRVGVPERRDHAEAAAAERLAAYVPGWFARTFGRERSARDRLQRDVEAARAKDDADHAAAVSDAHRRNSEIVEAQRIVERQPDAIVSALDRYSGLGDLPFSVEGIDTLFLDGRIIAIVDGLDLEDMPHESVTLLKSGKASVKNLAVGKRAEMHRDAICSTAIRVALELQTSLAIDEVEVLMLTDVLDRGSGHLESAPVLHLRATAQTLVALNLARAEPAAVMDRLGAHMDWSKRDGFRPINAAAFGIELGD